jgi:hypothetical protein
VQIHIYSHGQDLYLVRIGGVAGALLWQRDGERWVAEPTDTPAGTDKVEFPSLPADLQEEILAIAARAEAMGNQSWGAQN